MTDADLAKAIVESNIATLARLTEEVRELKRIINQLEIENHNLQVRVEQFIRERKQNT